MAKLTELQIEDKFVKALEKEKELDYEGKSARKYLNKRFALHLD